VHSMKKGSFSFVTPCHMMLHPPALIAFCGDIQRKERSPKLA